MTDRVLSRFRQVSSHPRRSRDEGRIRAWLTDWARDQGFETRPDAVGNLVIAVPASPGMEAAPIVVLQGHMDMVCEKVPGCAHDFSRDPILPVVEGDWLTAPETSLGADSGIAIAMAMELATSPEVVHGPLELLFTIDGETGMTGALGLDPSIVRGRTLLNLDSAEEGVLTVGCAGGAHTRLRLPLETDPSPAGMVALRLVATGMVGGHSGADIHLQRANAIRVLARTLDAALTVCPGMRLVELSGGTAQDTIPRHAEARLLVPREEQDLAGTVLDGPEVHMCEEFAHTDPALCLELHPDEADPRRPWTRCASRRAVDLLLALPHGVAAMSADVDGRVETSNNEATVAREGDHLVVWSSQRSSVPSRLEAHTHRIEALARLAGAEAETGNRYPPWPPDMASPLLARCRRIYVERTGREPSVAIIHAGLECGLLRERLRGTHLISVGPTIRFSHSPDEKLQISSVGMLWDYVVAILGDLTRA